MIFEIKSRWDRSVLFSFECGSLKLCVEEAVMRGADLGGAYLRGVNLHSADLRGAYLRGVNLHSADLGGADLRGSDLRGVNLHSADLRGADLRGADLGEKGKPLLNGYFTAGPLGSRNDNLQAFHTDKGIWIMAGCFFDSIEAFRAAVIKTHGEDSKHGKLYLNVANLIEYKFSSENGK